MPKPKSEVLLFSGGMDSYIAWYYLGRPDCVYCDLGHRYAKIERQKIEKCTKTVGMDCRIETRLDLSDWEECDANIPMRNLFLSAIAAKDPNVNLIWLISQKGETSIPDRSPAFMESAGSILSQLNGRKILVRSPFIDKTKMDMVGWYVKQYGTTDLKCRELISNTFGCYKPTPTLKHCGLCPACFRRFIAFKGNNVDNSFEYENDILTAEITQVYYKRFLRMELEKDWGQYGKARVQQTLEVLRALLH